jgi:hypothetical protein
MTGSKGMVVYLKLDSSCDTYVQYEDSSRSKVLGLGKVIISPDTSIENAMLVETLSYDGGDQ